VSKKTFYTFFAQKEELVEAVVVYQRKQRNDRFEKLFKNKNAIDSLILSIKELRKVMDQESAVMCNDLEKYYPRVNEKYEQISREEIRAGFESFLNQGIAEGYFREDLDIEMIALFHSVQLKYMINQMAQFPQKYSRKRIYDFFIDLMIHLIANEKGLQYLAENYNKVETSAVV
jgi:AcrR family transcriptional regulator